MAKGKARDRQATEARLLKAVETVLTQEGFSGLGVNAVAREAGIDKVLIYRYFNGMPGLLRAFAYSDAFWPTVEEVLGEGSSDLSKMPVADRWSAGLVRYARALRRRPIVGEILAWEQVEKNELTEILRLRREEWFAALRERLPRDDDPTDAVTVSTVLVIGTAIHYLIARSRLHGDFNGLAIESDADWAHIEQIIHTMCSRTLQPRGEA
ncbi:MAG: TetR family transcriptional regulator [Gemmatimonas sp.]|nr:TetR family transcriptional regulator [Gemmatimonas sp.]